MQPSRIDDVVALIVAAAKSASTGHGQTIIIGIDGRSGTGKTTAADRVATSLGCQEVVHMDDLYPGWHGLAPAVPRLTQEVLRPISRGERAAYRRYDWAIEAYAETVHLVPGRFLVVEGCGSTAGPARAYTDVRVWLDAPTDVRMARGLERDGGTFSPMWRVWQQQEDALFESDHTRDHAHLLIRTG